MELQIIFAEINSDEKAFKMILNAIIKHPEKYRQLNFMLEF
jgi:hypothetical protein